jgi:hypothetical protein
MQGREFHIDGSVERARESWRVGPPSVTLTTSLTQRQTRRRVTIAITLTSCVVVLAVNWLGVFDDIRQAVTVIVGAIGTLSALVTWWTLPE